MEEEVSALRASLGVGGHDEGDESAHGVGECAALLHLGGREGDFLGQVAAVGE